MDPSNVLPNSSSSEYSLLSQHPSQDILDIVSLLFPTTTETTSATTTTPILPTKHTLPQDLALLSFEHLAMPRSTDSDTSSSSFSFADLCPRTTTTLTDTPIVDDTTIESIQNMLPSVPGEIIDSAMRLQPSFGMNLGETNTRSAFSSTMNAADPALMLSQHMVLGSTAFPALPTSPPPMPSDAATSAFITNNITNGSTRANCSSNNINAGNGYALMLDNQEQSTLVRRHTQPLLYRRSSSSSELVRAHPYIPSAQMTPRRSISSLTLHPNTSPQRMPKKTKTYVIPSINHDGSVKSCSNCKSTDTPSWRRHPESQDLLCNACGLYLRLHRKPRPIAFDEEGNIQVIRKNAAVRRDPVNLNTSGTSFSLMNTYSVAPVVPLQTPGFRSIAEPFSSLALQSPLPENLPTSQINSQSYSAAMDMAHFNAVMGNRLEYQYSPSHSSQPMHMPLQIQTSFEMSSQSLTSSSPNSAIDFNWNQHTPLSNSDIKITELYGEDDDSEP